jgi:hypothetical protein
MFVKAWLMRRGIEQKRTPKMRKLINMKAAEKYDRVFGSIDDLVEKVPWTTGLSNMVEWLSWETGAILGISKTRYWKRIVSWCCQPEIASLSLEEKIKVIDRKLKAVIDQTDNVDRYAQNTDEICGPREALRRLKYASENYLNKEFDVFLSLASDAYLDKLYSQFFRFQLGGEWATHGNSGLFEYSFDVTKMQMDNLAYNETAGVLVANELKLGGKKNKDQILKYSFLYKHLTKKKFVTPGTKFFLLFIGDTLEDYDWQSEVDREIEHCRKKARTHFLKPDIVEFARCMSWKGYTWEEMIGCNKQFSEKLPPGQQVERKLLSGFNQSLQEKKFIQIP